eukprot:5210316-Pleurochrysis_carterae.AAC.1
MRVFNCTLPIPLSHVWTPVPRVVRQLSRSVASCPPPSSNLLVLPVSPRTSFKHALRSRGAAMP